jgi:DNA repair exonuclease SbcCD nuclease subunit
MIEYGIQNKINNMVIAGDTFHNKSILYTVAQSIVLDIVRQYSNNMHFIFLSGNHDMSSMTGDGVSATKCLDNEKNVTTIHTSQMIENILFVPWNPRLMISTIKEGNADYLISHLGLNEGILNSGISLVSDIGLKDLKQYKHVYLGHYHTPQKVGNVTYVGNPTHLDWNDKNQEKRFIVFDSETGEEKSIPTSGYKKHYEFNITLKNKDEILEEATKLKSEGHFIKINKTDNFDLSSIEKDFDVVDKTEQDVTNRGINSSMSTSDKLNRFLEIKEISVEKRDSYRNIALDIMNSVSEMK